MIYPLFFLLNIAIFFYPDKKEMLCPYTEHPVIIDGKLNEWDQAIPATFQRLERTDNKVTVRTLWDNTNLYIAYQVQDKDLQAIQTVKDHPLLYKDDMVEFLIDTKYKKDSCWNADDIIYHINLHGQKKDDIGSADCITDPTWDGNANYVITMFGTLNDSTDVDSGYIIEMAISWKELANTPSPGLKLAVDFCNGDNGKLFDWSGASPFRSPYAFGDLILQRE